MPALSFPSSSALSNTDDARLSRVEAVLPRRVSGANLFSNSTYAVPSATTLLPSGKISPTSGIASTGNVFPFVTQGQFGFNWDGSNLTIYWDGTNGSVQFVVRRADGTTVTVPRGSLLLGSVQPNTKYGFAPFVSVAQPQRVSFVAGDTGAPRYAFSPNASGLLLSQAQQTQRLTQNERLTDGFIYFTTGASYADTAGGGTAGGNTPYTGNQDPNSLAPQ